MGDKSDQPAYKGGDLEAAVESALNEAASAPIPPATGYGAPPADVASDASRDELGLDEGGFFGDLRREQLDDPLEGTPKGGSGVLAFFRELPVLLGVAFLLAFLLRTFVVQVFYIPSGSMEPTLQINDRIIVEKVTYLFREPERGEIVVFEGESTLNHQDDGLMARVTRGVGQFLGVVPANARDFVKRVIGLPGDTIVIEDGIVMVNGVELDEPYAVDDRRDFGPFEVPEGRLFFLGDNRPSSADSRLPSALGYVDMDRVVGRAMVVVWPIDNFNGLGRPEYDGVPAGDGASGGS